MLRICFLKMLLCIFHIDYVLLQEIHNCKGKKTCTFCFIHLGNIWAFWEACTYHCFSFPFYWNIADLQSCVSFCCSVKWSVTCALNHFSHVQLFETLWTVSHQARLSMGFSRQEYWNGLPCPPPGYLPDPGIKPMSLISPALAGGFFTTSTTWEVPCIYVCKYICTICMFVPVFFVYM